MTIELNKLLVSGAFNCFEESTDIYLLLSCFFTKHQHFTVIRIRNTIEFAAFFSLKSASKFQRRSIIEFFFSTDFSILSSFLAVVRLYLFHNNTKFRKEPFFQLQWQCEFNNNKKTTVLNKETWKKISGVTNQLPKKRTPNFYEAAWELRFCWAK